MENMMITLSVKDLFTILLGAAGFVLLIFLIIVAANLVTTVKKLNLTLDETNKVLEDVEVITDVAQSKTTQAADIVDGFASAAAGLASGLKGNQNSIAAITSVVNGATALRGILSDSDKKSGKSAKAKSKKK